MSGDVVIRVEGLCKKYVIAHQNVRDGSLTFRDTAVRKMSAFGRSWRQCFTRSSSHNPERSEEFWALKDVNFELRRGEIAGIVGKNGAGKSTLLKILARITEPTSGRVETTGRVASLLEVGTGFHPELTGRENVYLNGAILGMRREEIRRKFDEIIAFAGVERFLDTPVKRYSSGMYARLAFAVAAHLDPDILIIDEVLAVGDAEFQQKCLGKMRSVAEQGRTVLFVSHNMAAVEQLCSRALLLEAGCIRTDAEVQSVVTEYLHESRVDILECRPEADVSRTAEVKRITVCDPNGTPLKRVTVADTVGLRIELEVRDLQPDLKLAASLHDSLQRAIFSTSPPDDGVPYPTVPGSHQFLVMFPGALLLPQRYFITVSVYTKRAVLHNCVYALTFEAWPAKAHVYSVEPNRVGTLQVLCSWTHKMHEPAPALANLQN